MGPSAGSGQGGVRSARRLFNALCALAHDSAVGYIRKQAFGLGVFYGVGGLVGVGWFWDGLVEARGVGREA